MTKFTAIDIADYILQKHKNNNIAITPLKLMQLVYESYSWYLALTGNELFDEDIEAWTHGVVIQSIYREFTTKGISYNQNIPMKNNSK